MSSPESLPTPQLATRLRRFGQQLLTVVLVGVLVLWVQEFFTEAADPRGWKLLVLLPLLLVGAAGSGALLVAAVVDWRARARQ